MTLCQAVGPGENAPRFPSSGGRAVLRPRLRQGPRRPPRVCDAPRRRRPTGTSTTSHADIRSITTASRGSASMTVNRREGRHSKSARPGRRRPSRIAKSPILGIVPCVIRRLRTSISTSGCGVGVLASVRGRGRHLQDRQTKPASSRATATAIFGGAMRVSPRRRNRPHKRCCALSAMAMARAGWPTRRWARPFECPADADTATRLR